MLGFCFIKIALCAIIYALGGVPEWTNGALSKSVRVLKALSGVRIPPPPRMKHQTQIIYNLVLIIFALVGVIVVLALYIVGALDFLTQERETTPVQTQQQTTESTAPTTAPEPAPAQRAEPESVAPTPVPEPQPQTTQGVEQPTPEPAPQPAPPQQTQPPALPPEPASQPQPAQPAQPFNDKDCGDFQTHAQAQAFFESQGGPAQDPHKLDRNKDGVVCESLL